MIIKNIRTVSFIFVALAFAVQWILIHGIIHPGPSPVIALLAGFSIFGAAFLLSWAAEVIQFDIPQSLAVAFVALLAVLPEYAVDMYFAWTAGKDPSYISYAAANMTGSNRLLIGFGWAVVLLAYFIRSKKGVIEIAKSHRLEILALFIATIYSFLIPLSGTITVFDAAVLITIFGFYIYKAATAQVSEPELEGGPAELISRLSPMPRRIIAIAFFAIAGAAIYMAAEPFAESLLVVGEKWGIEKFILVQWIAPLASESPEFLVAILFAWNMKPSVGLGTLISSKVNQWTLLVGMLPLAYCLSAGKLQPMHMDARQVEEIFLTAAQSLFALVVIADLRFKWFEALLLAVLFMTQLFIPSTAIRMIYAWVYILLTVIFLLSSKDLRKGMVEMIWEKESEKEEL